MKALAFICLIAVIGYGLANSTPKTPVTESRASLTSQRTGISDQNLAALRYADRVVFGR